MSCHYYPTVSYYILIKKIYRVTIHPHHPITLPPDEKENILPCQVNTMMLVNYIAFLL